MVEKSSSKPEFAFNMDQILSDVSVKWHEVFVAQASQNERIEAQVAFPTEYQYRFSPIDGANDFAYFEKLSDQSPPLYNLQKKADSEYVIKIYSNNKIFLSDMLPLVEHLGFKASSQRKYLISIAGSTKYLSEFHLFAKAETNLPFDVIKQNVEDALYHMSIGELEHDKLCNLIMVSGLKWRQINILKAITTYLGQTGFAYGREYVQEVMVQHSEFSELLIKFFESKFHPDPSVLPSDVSIAKQLSAYLNSVTNAIEDKVLRTIQGIIEAISRTNYYQTKLDGAHKTYLSFKFASANVPDLPLPHPFAEIFVYSNDFEGIHLRGGRVARGGIRWSDRKEDYRTEALGLMKAQMTKNSVIVPVGSKGAFFVKIDATSIDRKEYMVKVVECYKNFLRGLLDITDNIIDGKVIHPGNVVAYDGEDPYLVVAADKGTATFSDYANAVSEEYNFWLGDAFASGGSRGYDHKKIAITSKGAWISVTRHFAEMGIDVQKAPITVVGIGDMSGDVFGNGMLMSKSMQLVAAFNHAHIFLDPNPNSDVSFEERKKLFEMPGSKWSDYTASLISQGGGVFERSAKKIAISSEVKAILGTDLDEATPEALINIILKAPVDLIWNGGIGTYVKASSESNLEVGDKANDKIRCNGNQLRAKVVGEGGNLGFSQLGRIEFAKAGGRINADFIDNSAGVDCSDHEVNIKIAFGLALKSGDITLEERDKLLAEMTGEVERLVLQDNFKQTAALTIAQHSPAYNTGMFVDLMHSLESEGLLLREVEFLPSDIEVAKMSAEGAKMTRPELAVLMSYSKMSVYRELLKSSIAEDPVSVDLLLEYFPPMMREKFRKEILSHPLKKEIVLTVITNSVINQLGSPIIKQIQSETGAKLCDIIRAYMIINKIFDIRGLWRQAEDLFGKITVDAQVEIFSELIKLLRRGICWIVRNLEAQGAIEVSNIIEFYGESAQKLCGTLNHFLLGAAKERLETHVASYVALGAPEDFAAKIAGLDSGVSTLDILLVSNTSMIDRSKIAELYFKVADYFSIDWMRKCAEKQMTDSFWNRLSIQSLKDDLYDKQRRVLKKIIEYDTDEVKFDEWLKKHAEHIGVFTDFTGKIKLQENIDLNMMIIANKQFEILLRKV